MAELQRTLEALIAARFPTAPLSPAQTIHRITGVDGQHRLSIAVGRVIDLARAERRAVSCAAGGRVEGGGHGREAAARQCACGRPVKCQERWDVAST